MRYVNYLSALLSVIAITVSVYAVFDQRRASMVIANIQFLNDKLTMLKQNPKLLEIHGITKQDLKENNLTAYELIYMLNSVYSAQAFYFTGNYSSDKLSSYRLQILKNKKFERAWKQIIRNRMTARTPFTDLIDRYYSEKDGKTAG